MNARGTADKKFMISKYLLGCAAVSAVLYGWGCSSVGGDVQAGRNALQTARPSDAVAYLARAAAADPDYRLPYTVAPGVLALLGRAYVETGRDREARQTLERAVNVDKDDPFAHLYLGIAMLKTGDPERGRKEIDLGLKLIDDTLEYFAEDRVYGMFWDPAMQIRNDLRQTRPASWTTPSSPPPRRASDASSTRRSTKRAATRREDAAAPTAAAAAVIDKHAFPRIKSEAVEHELIAALQEGACACLASRWERKILKTSSFTTRTGAAGSPWCSATAGRSARMPGRTRCCSWHRGATAGSPTTGAATAARARPGAATTWTPTPTTWRNWSRPSI